MVLLGTSYRKVARTCGISPDTVLNLVHSPRGQAFLEEERVAVDDHRTLLAACSPLLRLSGLTLRTHT